MTGRVTAGRHTFSANGPRSGADAPVGSSRRSVHAPAKIEYHARHMSTLNEQPNALAPPARLITGPGVAIVRGYQNFSVTPEGVTPAVEDGMLRTKQSLMAPVWDRKLLYGRHVLDLGANAAFFALWSLEHGAASATAVDMDSAYLDIVARFKFHLKIDRLQVAKSHVDQWKEPADVVLALALVHWVYSCTSNFGSLDAVIGWLASLARYALVIEWVSPEDFAITGHGHTSFNADTQQGPYTYTAFRAALRNNFARVVDLGFLTNTRRLFIAYKKNVDLDLSGPLPLLHDAATLLASRWLTSYGPLHYWSRVYDLGDSIVKQASFDLAAREAQFLQRVAGPHFPRVLESQQAGGYSTLRIEKIQGEPLYTAGPKLRADRNVLRSFFAGCLQILEHLKSKGIRHRDIHADNIIIRNHQPVLLDFAWAVADDSPYISPAPLGELAHACDTVGMGSTLATVIGQPGNATALDSSLNRLILAMMHPDERLRVTDIRMLNQMLADAFDSPE